MWYLYLSEPPDSHLLTDCRVTPKRSASCSWESPAFRLSSVSFSQNCILVPRLLWTDHRIRHFGRRGKNGARGNLSTAGCRPCRPMDPARTGMAIRHKPCTKKEGGRRRPLPRLKKRDLRLSPENIIHSGQVHRPFKGGAERPQAVLAAHECAALTDLASVPQYQGDLG